MFCFPFVQIELKKNKTLSGRKSKHKGCLGTGEALLVEHPPLGEGKAGFDPCLCLRGDGNLGLYRTPESTVNSRLQA